MNSHDHGWHCLLIKEEIHRNDCKAQRNQKPEDECEHIKKRCIGFIPEPERLEGRLKSVPQMVPEHEQREKIKTIVPWI
jgi:hypothetical protein